MTRLLEWEDAVHARFLAAKFLRERLSVGVCGVENKREQTRLPGGLPAREIKKTRGPGLLPRSHEEARPGRRATPPAPQGGAPSRCHPWCRRRRRRRRPLPRRTKFRTPLDRMLSAPTWGPSRGSSSKHAERGMHIYCCGSLQKGPWGLYPTTLTATSLSLCCTWTSWGLLPPSYY